MTIFTEFETLLITCLPALTSIISIIAAVTSVLKSLNALKDNEEIKAERDALKEQNEILLSECRKTRKLMSLYIEKAVKIKYEDITEVKDDKDLQI